MWLKSTLWLATYWIRQTLAALWILIWPQVYNYRFHFVYMILLYSFQKLFASNSFSSNYFLQAELFYSLVAGQNVHKCTFPRTRRSHDGGEFAIAKLARNTSQYGLQAAPSSFGDWIWNFSKLDVHWWPLRQMWQCDGAFLLAIWTAVILYLWCEYVVLTGNTTIAQIGLRAAIKEGNMKLKIYYCELYFKVTKKYDNPNWYDNRYKLWV